MFRPAALLLSGLAVFAALSGCQSEAELPPYRCLGELKLANLGKTSELPLQGGSGSEMGLQGRVFDLAQQMTLAQSETQPAVQALCRQLQAQLASRCEIVTFWSGTEHCAALVQSPVKAVTDKRGVYTHQHFVGRVNLFTALRSDGRADVVLTGSEWAH